MAQHCSSQFYFLFRSEKPHWHDILPLKLSIWLYYSLKSLPHVIQVGAYSVGAITY